MAFPTTSILDNFNRADEGPPPSTNWTSVSNGSEVVSNQAKGTASAGNWDNWNVETFGPDSECYVYLPSTFTAQNIYVRLSSPSINDDGYRVSYFDIKLAVTRHDNGVGTKLGADISQAVSGGDSMGAEMVGSTITVYFNDNGGGWSSMGTRTDTTYTVAGYIGARTFGQFNFDDFGGGTVVAAGGGLSIPVAMRSYRNLRV